MANEHVLLIETELPVPMTVADGTTIEKGTLLKMTDPDTAIASAAADDIVAGVAKKEKIASDGNTKLAVYRGGQFTAVASGSITVGDALVTAVPAGTNLLATAGVNAENIVGIALETATVGQTFKYELKPRSNNLA
jgi:hypothetical protein